MNDKEALAFVLRQGIGSRVHKKLAESVGLNPTALSQYVNAIRFPRPKNFDKVCEAIGQTRPTVKGAMAHLQRVADTGGDETRLKRELERYLAAVREESASETLDDVRDARTQGLLDDLRKNSLDQMRKLKELSSHLAVTDRTT